MEKNNCGQVGQGFSVQESSCHRKAWENNLEVWNLEMGKQAWFQNHTRGCVFHSFSKEG